VAGPGGGRRHPQGRGWRLEPARGDELDRVFSGVFANSEHSLSCCPQDGASEPVRVAFDLPQVARLAQRHKQAFRDRLVATAAEAGAADPESLGRQLAVIFEGANALAASSNDAEAFTDARRAANTLLDVALTTTPER